MDLSKMDKKQLTQEDYETEELFNSFNREYDKLTLSDLIGQIEKVYSFSDSLSDIFCDRAKADGLTSVEFYSLWTNKFFNLYLVWSGDINREVRARIEMERESDILMFQKYCYLYQYWWILFHLITKHFTNFKREKIVLLEDKLKKKIEVISDRLRSKEIIDRFTQKDFDYLLNLEKMS